MLHTPLFFYLVVETTVISSNSFRVQLAAVVAASYILGTAFYHFICFVVFFYIRLPYKNVMSLILKICTL